MRYCKLLFIIVNIIMLMLGISVTWLAYNFLCVKDSISDILLTEISIHLKYNPNLIWALVIFGLAWAITGLLGCLVALSGVYVFTVLFLISLIGLISANLAYSLYIIYSLIFDAIEFSTVVNAEFQKYNHDKNIRQVIDNLQEQMKCCGVESYLDWLRTNGYIPHSCCAKKSNNETCSIMEVNERGGCLIPLQANRRKGSYISFVYMAIIVATQIVTVLSFIKISPPNEKSEDEVEDQLTSTTAPPKH